MTCLSDLFAENECCVYVYEQKCKYCNSDASAFVETPCNCIDLLFTHAYMCDYSIVVHICVCSIARTGCY